MRVVEKIRALQACADAERAAGRRIALVPTLGALHAGHLSLFEEARRRADAVWVSIFLNPTQFDDAGDLERYPRPFEADLAACRAAGVDLVFAPHADEMYCADRETAIEVAELSKPLCGTSRPGHFRAVCTVVAKLLLAAKPHVAVFGEKDFQQLAVIRRMVRDLNFDVEIVGAPTVREADGLALSSRNAQLDPEARRQAAVLARALDAAEAAVAAGERDAARLVRLLEAEIAKAPRAEIDYAELRDPQTLRSAPAQLTGPTLAALAVFLRPAAGAGAGVRLLDNRVLHPQPGARR
ncbi:MAG TPA: pantoate--beta-alanine ligase [Myxococcota bacterium]